MLPSFSSKGSSCWTNPLPKTPRFRLLPVSATSRISKAGRFARLSRVRTSSTETSEPRSAGRPSAGRRYARVPSASAGVEIPTATSETTIGSRPSRFAAFASAWSSCRRSHVVLAPGWPLRSRLSSGRNANSAAEDGGIPSEPARIDELRDGDPSQGVSNSQRNNTRQKIPVVPVRISRARSGFDRGGAATGAAVPERPASV